MHGNCIWVPQKPWNWLQLRWKWRLDFATLLWLWETCFCDVNESIYRTRGGAETRVNVKCRWVRRCTVVLNKTVLNWNQNFTVYSFGLLLACCQQERNKNETGDCIFQTLLITFSQKMKFSYTLKWNSGKAL